VQEYPFILDKFSKLWYNPVVKDKTSIVIAISVILVKKEGI
jgi:hypothetical protein